MNNKGFFLLCFFLNFGLIWAKNVCYFDSSILGGCDIRLCYKHQDSDSLKQKKLSNVKKEIKIDLEIFRKRRLLRKNKGLYFLDSLCVEKEGIRLLEEKGGCFAKGHHYHLVENITLDSQSYSIEDASTSISDEDFFAGPFDEVSPVSASDRTITLDFSRSGLDGTYWFSFLYAYDEGYKGRIIEKTSWDHLVKLVTGKEIFDIPIIRFSSEAGQWLFLSKIIATQENEDGEEYFADWYVCSFEEGKTYQFMQKGFFNSYDFFSY